ncbi:hypothetical protein WB66_24030 [bacteria symbiont BFo1 of Frankliniella occidentalis]|uniref:hypothetical protein n=1 Tax=Erwinia aphidicola TaxID=68334 RepID=UPI0006647E66|nr:hypothetical protein [Erwinia aphidicola]KMV67375.1 hypothetical protein AI28_18900 [bacteria symbiont BFo1 of Frankliniella occidentalis]KYP82301.1 hypothetical protein WB66_24030 [bacteria symbiont BFo1 of Frankliniella occidentalis]KYP86880.1 hypothetical protein WB91_22740 [bacteria symbiont BFo1 of Frankliniella occidentalis]PIJ52396.1 hypothetical protein BOM23_22270 [Erwinia sp. OLMDLW33]
MALVWFLIVTLRTLFKGGQDGKVFSAGRSMLHPLMSSAGFITLVPTASGWSLSQLVMLWARHQQWASAARTCSPIKRLT